MASITATTSRAQTDVTVLPFQQKLVTNPYSQRRPALVFRCTPAPTLAQPLRGIEVRFCGGTRVSSSPA